MLHISLDKLPGRCAKDVFACTRGGCVQQSHDILELITKAKCSAGLEKSGASPEAATQRLIEKPAIEQIVDGRNRSDHFNLPKQFVPPSARRIECCLNRIAGAKPDCQSSGFFNVPSLPEQKHNVPLFVSTEFDGHLQGGAGIQPRANPAR